MNASTRKCTEAKRCKLVNCYDCRRYLIDTTAARMLDSGVEQASVDQYRYSAINALAWEIETPKPKAPRKPAATVDPGFVETVLSDLRECSSRVSARVVLRDLTVAQLKAVAKAIDLGGCSKYRKDGLVEHLINFTVGMREDHGAIAASFKR